MLLNFRRHRVALVSDVQKAFLQIAVNSSDRDALRFLWFSEKPDISRPLPEVEVFRMARVPFGTTSSPFFLAATLQHHFATMKHDLPETVTILQQSIYVDDLLCGAENEEEATKIYEEANFIFEKASMRLHKWASNSDQLRTIFAYEDPTAE